MDAATRKARALSFTHASDVTLTPAPAPAPVIFPPSANINWTPQEPPELGRMEELGFDTETTGLRWWSGDRPVGISVSYAGAEGWVNQYLPFGHDGGNLDEAVVKRWAERELRGKHLVGANIRFDIHMMREWGIDLEAQGCTFSDVAHQAALLDEYRKEFTLDSLCKDYLPETRKTGQGLDKSRMASYHAGEVAAYAETDGQAVLELADVYATMLYDQRLERVRDLENAVIPVVVEMERNAAHINRSLLREWVHASQNAVQEYLHELTKTLGFDLNPDKATDMARMFDTLGIEVTTFTGKGAPSFTDALLATIDHPLVQRARAAGKLMSLRSKFLCAYDDVVGEDNKLRFALHQLRGDEYGTIRGRFSMSGGSKIDGRFGANLQQVFSVDKQREAFGIDPKDGTHDDAIYLIRRLFIPERGDYLGADAQSIEYRLAAHFAASPKLLRAYKADWAKLEDPSLQDGTWVDFHQVVQDIITPHKVVTRKTTKNLNFLKIYGGGRDKAAETLGMSRVETDLIIDTYDDLFPEFKDLLKDTSKQARDKGFVTTLLGRRARFPKSEVSKTHAALNYVVQGSAADVMKQKLVELHAERKHTGFLMRQTVHDEVDGDAQDGAETLRKVVEILNRQSFDLSVPIIWKGKIGATWAEC